MSAVDIAKQLLDAYPRAELLITKSGAIYSVKLREEQREASAGQYAQQGLHGMKAYDLIGETTGGDIEKSLATVRDRLARQAAERLDGMKRHLETLGGQPTTKEEGSF